MDATVMIAAYNAADQLQRSVESALVQTGLDVEVVIVDDCSPDPTTAKAADLAASDPRIRHDRLIRNKGPAGARNRALELARGTWVAVLDADDSMEPGRLAEMTGFADRVGADVVLGNFRRVDGDGLAVEDAPFATGPGFAEPRKWDLARYIAGNRVRRGEPSLGYLKPVIRRAFLEQHQIRYDEALRNGEDCHLVFRCLVEGAAVWFHPAPSYLYTVQRGSVSFRVNPDHIDALLAADRRLLAAFGDRIGGEERALFSERHAALTQLMRSERALGHLKGGNLAGFAGALARHPGTIPRVLRQMLEALGNRLQARS
ncbi:MAG: glycosyltransferase family 2 protein [Pseudomonadota bacterium]